MAGQKKCEIGKSRRIQKRYEICMVSLRECTTYRIIILFISHCKFLTLQGFHTVYGSESCRRPLRVGIQCLTGINDMCSCPQQLPGRYDLNACAKKLHGQFELFQWWQCRCYPYVAVLWVFSVWKCRPCRS